MTEETGLFARHKVSPSARALGLIGRREGARQVLVHLTARGLLTDIQWDYLTEAERDQWTEAIAEVFKEAAREATKAAAAELKAYEELALALECRRCGAHEGTRCWDMRTRGRVHVDHPHEERMSDMAEVMA